MLLQKKKKKNKKKKQFLALFFYSLISIVAVNVMTADVEDLTKKR